MLRTKTGIQGLDKALKNGIPEGNIVLLSGGAGTGKSTLALQFIVNGAKLFGERGLYISTEQNEEELHKQASSFGWDLGELQKKNLLKIMFFDFASGGDDILKKIDSIIAAFQPKRIVVDSMTTLTDSLIVSGFNEKESFSLVQVAETVSPIPRTEQIIAKTILYGLIKELKKHKLTTILTSELYEEFRQLSADGVSEFITDGVIILHYLGAGAGAFRTIRVRKMRYTDHEKASFACDITPKGIEIKEQEFNI